jgi:hypothetical protein
LRDHPKTKKLARLLSITRRDAVGLLHCFWWWALDYAQDGDLTSHDPSDVADAVDYAGKPEALLDALAGCGVGGGAGFLDRNGDGLRIHDWHDYAGRLIEKRRADAARKRESRTVARPPDVQRTSNGRPADDPRDGARTEPNRTEPNLTQPKNQSSVSQERERTRHVLEVFEHYRTYHPRALKKPKTTSKEYRKVQARLAEGRTVEELKTAIDQCHKSPWHLGDNPDGTKYLGLELIMRDDSHVQKFLEMGEPDARRKEREEWWGNA